MGHATVATRGADVWAGQGLGMLSTLLAVTGAAKLFTVVVYNTAAADRYVHIMDNTTSTDGVSTPDLPPLRVPAHSQGSVDFGAGGRQFKTAILVVNSSTETVVTRAGAEMFMDVGYRKGS